MTMRVERRTLNSLQPNGKLITQREHRPVSYRNSIEKLTPLSIDGDGLVVNAQGSAGAAKHMDVRERPMNSNTRSETPPPMSCSNRPTLMYRMYGMPRAQGYAQERPSPDSPHWWRVRAPTWYAIMGCSQRMQNTVTTLSHTLRQCPRQSTPLR